MWNENEVLELLKDMPQTLSDENLLKIQKLIDDNKYWNSRELQRDLCGIYAPFCRICDKSVLTPCAVAYVRMKIAEGMELSMENVASASPEEDGLDDAFEEEIAVSEEAEPQPEEEEEQEQPEEDVAVEEINEEVETEEAEQREEAVEEEPPSPLAECKKIRIGIGYKRKD